MEKIEEILDSEEGKKITEAVREYLSRPEVQQSLMLREAVRVNCPDSEYLRR